MLAYNFTLHQANNAYTSMQGMTLKSLKHHVALQPLFVIMGAGITFVALYIGRLASKTTDVNWTKKDIEQQYGYYENRYRSYFGDTLVHLPFFSGNSSGSTPEAWITAVSLTREELPTTEIRRHHVPLVLLEK